ncbi:MAG: AraC family transcriptional regulator [Candidatus Saccharimonadales bacterium]
MQIHRNRQSHNPFIERVWQTQNITDGVYLATPDMAWDFILWTDQDGSRGIMLAGQATKAVKVPYRGGTSSIVISLAPGVYLPDIPGEQLRDTTKFLPVIDNESFELLGHTFAFPTYENAEVFIEQLTEKGLIVQDEVVNHALNGKPKAMSQRNAQRHFSKKAGITKKELEQIERAQEAVRMLQGGASPNTVAATLGYTDQSHMTKSLKRIMDSWPSNVSEIHKL